MAVLTALAAFAVLQIAAAIVLERWFPGMIDPDYGVQLAHIRRDKKGANGLTVVVLGSSRAYHGMATDELSESLSRELGRPVSVYNGALPGCGAITELLTWRRLQRDGVRPDLLLVEALPGFLRDDATLYELSETRMPANHLRWTDLPLLDRYRAGTRPTLRRDVALMEAATLYSRRLGILHARFPDLLSADEAALLTPPGPEFLSDDTPLSVRAKYRGWAQRDYKIALPMINPDGSAGQALRELLASCRQTGTPAILVLMPEGPRFRSWYPAGKLSEVQHWLEQLGRDEGAGFVNAEEWIGEEDFLDSHHLLHRGAKRFAARLGREYLLPALQLVCEQKRPGQRAARRSP